MDLSPFDSEPVSTASALACTPRDISVTQITEWQLAVRKRAFGVRERTVPQGLQAIYRMVAHR